MAAKKSAIDVDAEVGHYAGGKTRKWLPTKSEAEASGDDDDAESDSDYTDSGSQEVDVDTDEKSKAKAAARALLDSRSKTEKKAVKLITPDEAKTLVAAAGAKAPKVAAKKKTQSNKPDDSGCMVCHGPSDGIVIPRVGLFREACAECAARQVCKLICDTCGEVKLLPSLRGLTHSCDKHDQHTMRCKSCEKKNPEKSLSACSFCRADAVEPFRQYMKRVDLHHHPVVDAKHKPTAKDEKANLRDMLLDSVRCESRQHCKEIKHLKACKGCNKFMCPEHLDSCQIGEAGSKGCVTSWCQQCSDVCTICAKRCCSRCSKHCAGCNEPYCKSCIRSESDARGKPCVVDDSDDDELEYACTGCKSESDNDAASVKCCYCSVEIDDAVNVQICDGADCTEHICNPCHLKLSDSHAQAPVLCASCIAL